MSDTEPLYRALLEAAPDAILAVTAEGRILLANTQAETLFGYSREQLVGQPVEMLVPEAARAIHPAHRKRYFGHPVTRSMGAGMELAARRQDGSEFPAEISLSAIETDQGLLISAAIRDVTDRKKAELKFRGLLEAAPDAILGVGTDGRIVLVNGRAEELFGYRRHELVGQPVEVLVPEASRAAHPRRREDYVGDPVPRPMGAGMELAGRRKDGSQFPCEISLSAIETEDGLLVSAAVRDVTEQLKARNASERLRAHEERELLEGQLHQSQRLESLGQLAGGIAHDFNNLLAVIVNYSSFVAEEIDRVARVSDGADWPGVQSDMQQIRRATDRAVELVHQLLAFGRREVVRPAVVDLNEVLGGVEQILRRSIGEHVELLVDAAPDLWLTVADPGQIEQVMVNLAVNARDSMPEGGTVTVRTRNVVVDDDYASTHPAATPGSYVRLEVTDTGAGMTAEVLEHAFEPFYTTKPKGEGSGLGLATVYGIVTQAGGHAQIYSEVGLGTTFRALFPVSAQEPVPVVSVPDERGRRSETVLIVEDEEALREVARRILTRNGLTVLTAASGPEAVEIARDHFGEIHLLLTDVIMPKMLGREVAERVRKERPDIRVLFMSGYAQPMLTSQGRLDETVRLVEKPFSEASLLAMVSETLDSPG